MCVGRCTGVGTILLRASLRTQRADRLLLERLTGCYLCRIHGKDSEIPGNLLSCCFHFPTDSGGRCLLRDDLCCQRTNGAVCKHRITYSSHRRHNRCWNSSSFNHGKNDTYLAYNEIKNGKQCFPFFIIAASKGPFQGCHGLQGLPSHHTAFHPC